MKIEITKEQYKKLVELMYLGDWVVNACRNEDYVKDYEDLEQAVYSHAKEADCQEYVEYDEEEKEYCNTIELDRNQKLDGFIDNYDDEIFWKELVERLAERDLYKKFGEKEVSQMSPEKYLEEVMGFEETYRKELEDNGLDNVSFG